MAANVDIARLTAKLILDVKEFTDGTVAASKALNGITKDNAWSTIGTNLNTLAKGAAVAGGAVVTGAGIATKAAIDFEDAFAGVKKTVNFEGTQKEEEAFFASLEKGIREMSTRMPVAATEIAGVTEAAGQLGIKNENLLSFAEVMIGLGSATNISATEAAIALAQFANVTKMSQNDFDRLGSSIVELGNNMATDEASIVNMATEMANLAQSCGMSEADIVGISAAMASMGLEAAASGTAMQRLTMDITSAVAGSFKYSAQEVEMFTKIAGMSKKELEEFAKTTNYTADELKDMAKDFNESQYKLQVFAETSGMTSEQFVKNWQEDATSAFLAFITGLGNKDFYEQLAIFDALDIKEMREIDMLQRMAGNSKLVNDAVDMSNKAWERNSALNDEVSKRNETTASKLQMVKNQLTDIAVEAGQALLPVVKQLLEQARPLLEKVSAYLKEHPDTVQRVTQVGVALLGIGTAVGVITKVVTTIGTFITAIKSIGTAISVLTGGGAAAGAAGAAAGGGGLLAALGTAITAVGPILLALAAVVGVFKLGWDNDWFGCQETFNQVYEETGSKVEAFKAVLRSVADQIAAGLKEWWNGTALPWFQNAWSYISQWVSDLWSKLTVWFSDLWNNLSTWFSNLWSNLTEWFSNLWNNLTDWFSNLWTHVSTWFSDLWNNLSAWFSNLWSKVSEVLSNIWSLVTEKVTSIWQTVTEKLSSIWQTVTEKLTDILHTVTEKMADVWETIKTKMAEIKDEVVDKVTTTWQTVKTTISQFPETVRNIFEQVRAAISDKIEAAKSAVSSAVDSMKSKIESVKSAISDAWDKVKSFASNAWDTASDWFGGGYAEGGSISSGRVYLVGEQGPELFVPNTNGYILDNDETMDLMGGETEINIYIQGDVYDDQYSMKKKLKGAMLDVLREQVAYA